MSGLVMLGSQAAGWVRGGRTAWRQRQRRAPSEPSLPAGLDAVLLLESARDHFLRLQTAWDSGDDAALAALTTPEMLAELHELRPALDTPPTRTEVLRLHARLLGVDDLGSVLLASIEFSGTVRDRPDHGPAPLRELWLMTRDHTPADAPWRLARQHALL